MQDFSKKIKEIGNKHWSLILMLLFAAVIRFAGLVKRDFWYDEAFTGIAVKESFHDMIIMIVNDVHPPLYYIVLKLFAYFFNYSVFGIRFFSAIFGVLSVWAVYLVAKELFNRKTALWACFFASISPFAIQYSQEGRMYSMLVFLILIASYFFIKGLNSGKIEYFILWGFFTGLSMLTHYMGIIFASTYAVVFFTWLYFQDNVFKGKSLKEKAFFVFKKITFNRNIWVGYLTSFIVFLPWLSKFLHHLTIKGDNLSWVKPANLGDIVLSMQTFLFGTPLGELSSGMAQPNEIRVVFHGVVYGISYVSIRMVLAVLFGLSISMLYRKENKGKISILVFFSLGFMGIIYLLSLLFVEQQYFVARYLLPSAFFMFIFIGVIFSNLGRKLILFLLVLYFFMISCIVPLNNSKGYNEMITHMDKYRNNDFYILNSFDYVITKYYLGSERLTLYNYDWPQYNPDYWAAIGKGLKRTENFDDLRNDPNALIISNKPLKDNQYFSTQGLVLVDKYSNILIYKFQN